MQNVLPFLIGLYLPLFAQADYSRNYLESHPLQIAEVGELDIAYRIVSPGPDKPKAVMIMGLGGSNVAWGDSLISGLANGGYEILLVDNRDTGASTRFDEKRLPPQYPTSLSSAHWARTAPHTGRWARTGFAFSSVLQAASPARREPALERPHARRTSVLGCPPRS